MTILNLVLSLFVMWVIGAPFFGIILGLGYMAIWICIAATLVGLLLISPIIAIIFGGSTFIITALLSSSQVDETVPQKDYEM